MQPKEVVNKGVEKVKLVMDGVEEVSSTMQKKKPKEMTAVMSKDVRLVKKTQLVAAFKEANSKEVTKPPEKTRGVEKEKIEVVWIEEVWIEVR